MCCITNHNRYPAADCDCDFLFQVTYLTILFLHKPVELSSFLRELSILFPNLLNSTALHKGYLASMLARPGQIFILGSISCFLFQAQLDMQFTCHILDQI